jgi:hypothetical protein
MGAIRRPGPAPLSMLGIFALGAALGPPPAGASPQPIPSEPNAHVTGRRMAEITIPSEYGPGFAGRLWNNHNPAERARASGIDFSGGLESAVRMAASNQALSPDRNAALNPQKAPALRWLQILLSTSRQRGDAQKTSGQLQSCTRSDPTSCKPVQLRRNQEESSGAGSVSLLPENATRYLDVHMDPGACAASGTACSLKLTSWRLAQELAIQPDQQAGAWVGPGLPDIVWVAPGEGGLLHLYDARMLHSSSHAAPWATLKLPEDLSKRLGAAPDKAHQIKSMDVPTPFTLVLGFQSGFVSLDFGADTCRAVTPETVWACKGGIAARTAASWIEGGDIEQAWHVPLEPIQSIPADPSAEGSTADGLEPEPLALGASAAVFRHASVKFTDPDTSGTISWIKGTPLAKAWRANEVHEAFEALPMRVFGPPDAGGKTSFSLGRSIDTPTNPGSVVILDGALNGLSAQEILPAASGVYVVGDGGRLEYIGKKGLQSTSVQASTEVRSLGARDVLVRRVSGSTCTHTHMRAHPDFPASLAESGLILPCGTSVRTVTGFTGVTAAVFMSHSLGWIVRWLE